MEYRLETLYRRSTCEVKEKCLGTLKTQTSLYSLNPVRSRPWNHHQYQRRLTIVSPSVRQLEAQPWSWRGPQGLLPFPKWQGRLDCRTILSQSWSGKWRVFEMISSLSSVIFQRLEGIGICGKMWDHLWVDMGSARCAHRTRLSGLGVENIKEPRLGILLLWLRCAAALPLYADEFGIIVHVNQRDIQIVAHCYHEAACITQRMVYCRFVSSRLYQVSCRSRQRLWRWCRINYWIYAYVRFT